MAFALLDVCLLLAFFCWDWNFWCPRAISDARPEEIIHNTMKKVMSHEPRKTIKTLLANIDF